ncbi:MAG: HAD family phosphatase [candidate division KSB1 bacterium]|nr:HAD family phosphatase [candidate division KSB1 bacterium]MDZ7340079.1 HAD family phosphatase [candidate division KSB1 bacterium]
MIIKAVLFDFDGVIANTLTYHVQAWQQVFAAHGVEILADDVCLLEGQLAEEIGRQLAQQKGVSLSEYALREMVRQKRAIYNQITQAMVYPAARRLIDYLKENAIKIALVTGALRQNVETVTGKEFLTQFDVIIAGNDVARTKPHPDPYLAAAEKLHVPPSNCLVIENAPLGIRAAKEAGMFCVALKTTIHDNAQLSEADMILENMNDLLHDDLLSQLFG